MRRFVILSALFLFAVFSTNLFSEEISDSENFDSYIDIPAKARKIPIEISGDKLEMEPNDTYIVTGNVVVTQGSTEIFCDKGTYNERTGLAQAIHNVKVAGEKFTVTCRRLDSHTKENFSIFSGNVKIVGENVTAYSSKANYYEKEEKLILIGNPRAESKDDPPNIITGRRIVYYFKNERAKVLGNVIADIQTKANNKNSTATHITGEKLMILPDGRYQVDGNLVATKADTTLYADRGIYDDTNEITESFGNVRVVNPKYTLKSGYLKNYSLEDRIIASVNPSIEQIIDRKKKRKSRMLGSDNDDEEKGDIGPSRDHAILKAVQIEALNGGEHLIARGNAELKQTPYLGEDEKEEVSATSTVNSDLMDIYSEEGKLVAKGNVVIKGHDINATGDRAIYFEEQDERREELRIIGNAVATQKKPGQKNPNVALGEEIHYFPDRDKVIIFKAKVKSFKNEKKNLLPEITDEVEIRKNLKKKKTEEIKLKSSANVKTSTKEVSIKKTSEVKLNFGTVKKPVKSPSSGRKRHIFKN